MNRVVFHERCMEVSQGAILRRRLVIWYYNVGDLSYVRTMRTYLTHTATLKVSHKESGEPKTLELAGYGAPNELHRLYTDLQTHILRERRQFRGVLMD